MTPAAPGTGADRELPLVLRLARCPRALRRGEARRYPPLPAPLGWYVIGCAGCGFPALHLATEAGFEEVGGLVSAARPLGPCALCGRVGSLAAGILGAKAPGECKARA